MNFLVRGLNTAGRYVSLELSATSPQEAGRIGAERGLRVLDVAPLQQGLAEFLKFSGKRKFSLLLFNKELLALLEAGLSIVEALETLIEKETRDESRYVLASVHSGLHDGRTLSAALETQSDVFPDLYVSMIRASERSGSLAESLSRYIAYQMQVYEMRKKVISASIYPLLLIGVGGMVVLFLLVYVIPKFSHIYADSGRELPTASWLLMRWGELIEQHGMLIFGIFGTLLATAIFAFTRPGFRGWLRELLWQLPVIGEKMRVFQLSRFYRTMGMLVTAGNSMMSSLDQVSSLLDVRLQARLADTKNQVRAGKPLSQSAEISGLTTPVAARLLRVGERTGQMGEMMERIALFYEEETIRWIERFVKLFEPLLMIFVGLLVGVIVVLMYFPIFELAGSLK